MIYSQLHKQFQNIPARFYDSVRNNRWRLTGNVSLSLPKLTQLWVAPGTYLDEFQLIDMNGRMYDPLLARFLSPDPFVQMPDFSQSFNRYSYALNNPFSYVDPSGELPLLAWIGIGIATSIGGYSGYKVAEEKGYDLGNWKTWGYMLGGAAIGGVSGYMGATIATGGGFMANTMGIMYSSAYNPMGMSMLSGGMIAPSISFGVASYNFGTGEWGHPGKKGNKWYENMGYVFGGLANASDIINLPLGNARKEVLNPNDTITKEAQKVGLYFAGSKIMHCI